MEGSCGELGAQQAAVSILALLASSLLPQECFRLTGWPTCGLIVVDADPLQLEVAVPMIGPSGVNTVLVTDDFPELEGGSTVQQVSSPNSVCVHSRCVLVWRSEDNFLEAVISFQRVCPDDQTCVVRIGHKPRGTVLPALLFA